MYKTTKKRKRVQLTIQDKLKVFETAKKNVPKSVLMSQFSIGKSTLKDILKSEDKLKQLSSNWSNITIIITVQLEKTSEFHRSVYGEQHSKPLFSKFGLSVEVFREIRLEVSQNIKSNQSLLLHEFTYRQYT